MPRVFHPKREKFVSASPPHVENTQYKIALGEEVWGAEYVPVLKIQMVYDGGVSGRRSPSYPLGTDDYRRVQAAVDELMSENEALIKKLT